MNYERLGQHYILGGRRLGALCLPLVAGAGPAIGDLCAGNARRIEKMFVADVGGVERLNGAHHGFNWLDGRIHRVAGTNLFYDFYRY